MGTIQQRHQHFFGRSGAKIGPDLLLLGFSNKSFILHLLLMPSFERQCYIFFYAPASTGAAHGEKSNNLCFASESRLERS